MKPKHRIFCPDCQRPKMQFETQKEADLFIKYNSDNMEKKPFRSYYCPMCCCWHISSHKINPKYGERERKKIEFIEWQSKRKKDAEAENQLRMSVQNNEVSKLMKSIKDRFDGISNRWLMNENNVSIKELNDFLNYIIDVRENNIYIGRHSKKTLNRIRISLEDKIDQKTYETK